MQAFTPFHPAIQYARRHDFLGFYDQEIEFREQLKYPPCSRIALLLLKGRNEEKVALSADHLRAELEKLIALPAGGMEKGQGRKGETENGEFALDSSPVSSAPLLPCPSSPAIRDLVIAGPAPAPLARAETFYRYQIMLRTRQMSALSRHLAKLVETIALPDDITLTVDIDPVNLS